MAIVGNADAGETGGQAWDRGKNKQLAKEIIQYLDMYTYDSRYGVILKQVPDDTQIRGFPKSPHAR